MSTGSGKVVIIGAGAVGATFAYALQIRGAAREIVLIDMDHRRAEGQALDLSHGEFFTPPVDIRAGDYQDCAGADVVAICAGAKQKSGQSRMDLVETNIGICKAIVEKIVEQTAEAILLVATNPVDVLTYAALHFSGLPKERVIGSGTVLDSARFRHLLSRHCGIDARNVHAYVLGEHGDSEVLPWSITTLAGMKMEDYCRACPQKCPDINSQQIATEVRTSAYHIIDAKGATNFAVGLALVKITTSIIRDENSALTVSTLTGGQYGISDVCLSLPAVLNSGGVDRIICPKLTGAEQAALKSSAETIRRIQRQIGLP
ncbi:L-lactate dehydrogenase [Pseudomonas sp.]|uniref:L-lactate dehydrogenase n=1 Tax=Pseudomonas sp. TaxID=306 RepID=UPI002729FF11|nr:L-lactate dehydrogenase [Pseudomonas sp.]